MAWNRAPSEAAQLRADLGLAEDVPAELEQVCRNMGISVLLKPLEGCSGLLIALPEGLTILLSSAITHQAWKNFTIAHELGHSLLHIQNGQSNSVFKDDSYTLNQWSNSSQEAEANMFAAEFLLPKSQILDALRGNQLNWPLIERLGTHFGASLRATARRCVELSSENIALTVTNANKVIWTTKSKSFAGQVVPGPVPTSSPGHRHSEWWSMSAFKWVQGGKLNLQTDLFVASRRKDSVEEILTLLWDESGEVFDTDQDEED